MDFLLAVKPDGHDRITNIFIYPTAGTADNTPCMAKPIANQRRKYLTFSH
jgi:hypothetical protein